MNMQGVKVLVIGGTGFIGSHLVRWLVVEGASVFVFSRANNSKQRLFELLPKIQIHEGDLTDENSILKCLKQVQPAYIYNVAGMRQVDRDIRLIQSSLEINFTGVLNFFKAILKLGIPVKGFVQTGTLEEYGLGPVPFSENQREQPVSPYSASKLAITQFCQMLYRSLKFPVVVLRPSLMYGPYQDTDMFVPKLIEACLKNEEFPMTSGEQTRDFTFVEDGVEAYLRCMDCPKALGEVINIGTGTEITIKALAKKIVQFTGSKTRLLFGAIPKRAAEIERLVCNNGKAKAILNWQPRTNFDAGLQKTIDWHKHRLKSKV